MDTAKKVVEIIKKIYGENKAFIPLHVPKFDGNEKKYLEECIDSTFVSSVGKFVDQFEIKIAEYTGAKNAIVCVNGTNAIHLSLILSGVKSNDLVITQPLTFVATVNAITYANASPLFIDVDKDTMGVSPDSLRDFLEKNTILKNGECFHKESGRRIKACLPMHTFGHACRIKDIISVCQNYNISVVEDAAEGMGSFLEGKHLGTFGQLGVISFNGNKIMTTGGGGIILTNDDEIAKRAKHLSTQAKIPHEWEYAHDDIGYNYRMPNLNAALGLAQLEQIDSFINKKREVAQIYKSYFTDSEVDFFEERNNEECNYWLNALILKNKSQRDHVLEYTNKNGVMTRPIWQLMTSLKMYEKSYKAQIPNSEWLEERVVNIPSSVI